MSENVVCLGIQSYNQIKSENTKFQLFISRLWESATLSNDKKQIDFDNQMVTDLMHLVYAEQYKKKLGALRAQDTKNRMAEERRVNEKH